MQRPGGIAAARTWLGSLSAGFVKLYGTILTSSIWLEPHSTLRVWIAMLATADEHGIVSASVGGLAHVSRVRKAECAKALETFLAPDEDSRTPDNDGRRIERVDGGWLILNHRKYRDLRTSKQVVDAERIRDKRETGEYDSRGPVAPVATKATRSNVATEAEAEAEAEAYAEKYKNASSPALTLESIASRFPNPAGALPMLRGMTQGLGSPDMKSVPIQVLAEAEAELRAVGGDFNPARFKGFVKKIIQRANNPPTAYPRRANGKESRNNEALAGWLAGQESEITDAEVVDDGE